MSKKISEFFPQNLRKIPRRAVQKSTIWGIFFLRGVKILTPKRIQKYFLSVKKIRPRTPKKPKIPYFKRKKKIRPRTPFFPLLKVSTACNVVVAGSNNQSVTTALFLNGVAKMVNDGYKQIIKHKITQCPLCFT